MSKHTPPRTRVARRGMRAVARKALPPVVLAIALVGLILADRAGVFGRRPADDRQTYDGREVRVVRVHDGDTFEVDVPDGPKDHTDVRFWGVDTPEVARGDRPGMHFGPEAAAFVRELCEGKTVRLELEPGRDTRDRKWNRLLAWVYLPDGRLLNRMLVERGYGYADPRFDHERSREFRTLQKRAMRDGRGLWKDVRPEDLPTYYRGKLELPAD